MTIAFSGPPAEIRLRGLGEKIDPVRSMDSLVVAPSQMASRMYFEGIDPPTIIRRETFSDDWSQVNTILAAAKAELPELDTNAILRTLLSGAVVQMNEGVFWSIVNTVASRIIETTPELTALGVGASFDLTEKANHLIDQCLEQLHLDWDAEAEE